MRILVEPGSYSGSNMGDVAMMQVAILRLRKLWPDAEVKIVTRNSTLLQQYCPETTSVSAESRQMWLASRSLLGKLHQVLPKQASQMLLGCEEQIWIRSPVASSVLSDLKGIVRRRKSVPSRVFLNELRASDLLFIAGMGGINDAFGDHADSLLDEIGAALHFKIPVAALGQGIGPITNVNLRKKASLVLPNVCLFGTRDVGSSYRLLCSLGVPPSKICMTGDDAIELAFAQRKDAIGSGVGINLRVASYAETDASTICLVRSVLQEVAAEFKSSLIPIPISLNETDSDARALQDLLEGVPYATKIPIVVQTPAELIRRIGDCRIVVTGAYHAAVFALAQGIPALCLSRSKYYDLKFGGIAEQYGAACRILHLDAPDLVNSLRSCMQCLWESAPALRSNMLATSAEYVRIGQATYRRLLDLVGKV